MKHYDKHVFWDLDDTLIITNPVYEQVNVTTANLVYNLIDKQGLTVDEIHKKMSEIDMANALQYGLSKERFIMSWVDTLNYYSNLYKVQVKQIHKNLVRDSAAFIYETILEKYPETIDTLQQMKSLGYEMNILTAGDQYIQTKRVMDANIREFFDNVYIVPSKTIDIMKNIIHPRNPLNCVMIGNSLRSDIHPSLSNDMFAIHIQRETWAYDKYEINFAHPKYHAINNLAEVTQIIHKIFVESVA